MRKAITMALLSLGLLVAGPGLVTPADGHGGGYRGPRGEVPPGTREPSDPPPPPNTGGPRTPGGDTPGPTTPGPTRGGDGGGDGGGGRPTTPGGGGSGFGGTGPSGPVSGSGGRRGGSTLSYVDWTFWWNYNKDEILDLNAVLARHRRSVSSGAVAHRFGRRRSAAEPVVPAAAATIRNRVVPALRNLLESDDTGFDVRSAAAIGLAKIGDHSIAPRLERMARNDKRDRYHRVVEESAGLAFGLLQKDTHDVRSFLVEMLGDGDADDSFVRPFCAVSLGLLGTDNDRDGASVAALLSVLAGKEPGTDVKPSCLVALGLLEDRSAVGPLLHMLEKGRVDAPRSEPLSDLELSYVVQALGKVGAVHLDVAASDLAVVNAVTKVLDDRRGATRNMRRSAAIALGRLARACDVGTSRSVLGSLVAVAARTKSADASLRNFALIAVARIGAASADDPKLRRKAVAVLRIHLEGRRSFRESRTFAALGLGLIGRSLGSAPSSLLEEKIRAPIRERFLDVKDPLERGAYAVASGMLADPLAASALRDTLTDRGLDVRLRGYSALALGMIGDTDSAAAVKDVLVNERDRTLRTQAAVAAGLIGDGSVVPALVGILRSHEESQYVLGSVALALGHIGDERAVDPLVDVATGNRGRYPELTRALATVALGRMGDRRDVPLLSRLGRDFNYRAGVPALDELLTIL